MFQSHLSNIGVAFLLYDKSLKEEPVLIIITKILQAVVGSELDGALSDGRGRDDQPLKSVLCLMTRILEIARLVFCSRYVGDTIIKMQVSRGLGGYLNSWCS